jgi:hypothetical protein
MDRAPHPTTCPTSTQLQCPPGCSTSPWQPWPKWPRWGAQTLLAAPLAASPHVSQRLCFPPASQQSHTVSQVGISLKLSSYPISLAPNLMHYSFWVAWALSRYLYMSLCLCLSVYSQSLDPCINQKFGISQNSWWGRLPDHMRWYWSSYDRS